MTRFLLELDAEDNPAIWDDETVTRSGDPMCVAHRDGDIIHIDPAYADQVWGLLTTVTQPSRETEDRLVNVFKDAWHAADERGEVGYRSTYGIQAVLAALTGTRDTGTDDAVGG